MLHAFLGSALWKRVNCNYLIIDINLRRGYGNRRGEREIVFNKTYIQAV